MSASASAAVITIHTTHPPISDNFRAKGRHQKDQSETYHRHHHCRCKAPAIIKHLGFRPRPDICVDVCRHICNVQPSIGQKVGGDWQCMDSCIVVEKCCLQRTALYAIHRSNRNQNVLPKITKYIRKCICTWP